MESKINPLLCDPVKGICEIPETNDSAGVHPLQAIHKPVRILYFTDPICSSCWGIEPQLRKLKLEYGSSVSIEYYMGGLLPNWSYNSGGISKPADVAVHWDEVSRIYNMPINGDVWLEDPLHSSYPPSIAFKAAQMQDSDKALVFLRLIRENVFVEKKNITRFEYLNQAAFKAGLDTARFRSDFEGRAESLFYADLELAAKMKVRGFPALFLMDSSGRQEFIYGFKPYAEFEQALLKVYPAALKSRYDTSWEYLFSKYPTLTTREYSELSHSTWEQSEKQLKELATENVLIKQTTKNGDLWKLAGS